MNINEQELSQAVERLREGEHVLGVNRDHVEDLMYIASASFEVAAENLLIEAYRTKLELEAGL